jgi:hypothetical protein
MDKLHDVPKTTFDAPAAPRVPQEPNEFTVQRQRAFEETARKIEELRRTRLARL